MTIFILKSLTYLDEDVLVIMYIPKMNLTQVLDVVSDGTIQSVFWLYSLAHLKQILIGTFDYSSQFSGDI